MRHRRRIGVGVVALLVACAAAHGLVLRADVARSAVQVEPTEYCDRDGRGAGAFAFAHTGPRWRTATAESNRWLVLASPPILCGTALRLFPEIAARAASEGSVTRVAFVLDGWRCVASRDVRQAGCSARLEGQDRYVLLLTSDDVGRLIGQSLVDGSIEPRLLAPFPRASGGGSGGGSGGASGSGRQPERYRGERAERCSAVTGPRWTFGAAKPDGWGNRPYPARQSGDRWRVWALGGLRCVAAQGWVDTVAPELVAPRFPGIRLPRTGEDDWRCTTGGKLLLGVCIRTSSPRGPLDFRGAIVFPDIPETSYPFAPISYEHVVLKIVMANRTLSPTADDKRICSTFPRTVPTATWRLPTRSGIGWLLGARGADLCFLAGAHLRQLAEWAATPVDGPRSAGVDGLWECSRLDGHTLVCAWNGLRIVAVPYLAHLAASSRASMVQRVLTLDTLG